MVKKLIKIIGIAIAIVGGVLCIISFFLPDDLQKQFVKAALAILMFDVIVAGILSRIFQIKNAVGEVKEIIREKKEESTSGENTDNLLDTEKREVEDKELNQPITSQVPNSRATSNYPKVRSYFNLVMLIVFLLIIVCAIVLFLIKQNIAGAIVVGCGMADIILLLIVNTIADKVNVSKRFATKGDDVLNTEIPRERAEVHTQLVEANESDAQVIWDMQKIAFAELLEKYGDYDTSPATETLSKVELRFQDPNTYHYFINADGKTVGVIRVVDPKTQEKKRLAQIFIMPEYRRNGYAHSSIKEVENIHGSTGWELDTILHERRLLTFYMRLGYKLTRQTKRVNSKMVLIVMEK